MANSKEAPSPEHVSLLENLREAYRIKQEISAWYRDTLTRALASGVSTAVIARYVGVTPQAISTARIQLRPSGKPESDVPEPKTVEDMIRDIQRIRASGNTSTKKDRSRK